MADEGTLKDKREAFVLAYIGECRFNATAAARHAGYEFPEVQGSRLLGNVSVRARIDKYLDDEALNEKEILAELADVARAEWRDFITVKMDRKTGEVIEVKMDLRSKIDALELLGKNRKMFTDNVQHGVTDDFMEALREFGRGVTST